jgi:L-fuculose-phosphate aldolase
MSVGHPGTGDADAANEMAMREAVLVTALEMSRSGLSPGRSGNVSCRFGDGMLVTPSGLAYETLSSREIVFVAADGTAEKDAPKPSSEWQFHLAAYAARPDMNALVHTHSPNATALACAGRRIPAFHYMVALAGGNDIPLVPYATFGTADLARYVADGLAHRTACLMANHGQIAMGVCLEGALELAFEVETLAAQYIKVLSLGEPVLLSDDEMERMVEKFRAYGRNAQAWADKR